MRSKGWWAATALTAHRTVLLTLFWNFNTKCFKNLASMEN
jgi:hypothetical protein